MSERKIMCNKKSAFKNTTLHVVPFLCGLNAQVVIIMTLQFSTGNFFQTKQKLLFFIVNTKVKNLI